MSSNAQKTHATKNGDGALKVVATYAIFSSLWILFSDAVVVFLFQDREVMTLVNTLKGWLFVAVTSLLLYAVVRGLIREAVEYSEREEVAARERERTALLLEAIVDGSGDAVFAKDRAGRYLLFNLEAGRVTGKNCAEVIGRDDHFLFPSDQAEAIRANDQSVMAEKCINTYEEVLSMRGGERVYLATKGPLRDRDGQVIGVFGISRDITERKRAEDALRQSEESFRLFFERNSSVMLLINPVTGEIIDANREAVRYYGHDREKLLKLSINEINALSPERVALARQRAMHGERTVFDFVHRLASGELRDVEVYVTPIETMGQPQLLSIIHDVTERKRTEHALRESEERLRMALNASSQGWFDIDLRSGKVDVSPEYVRMIGYDPDNFDNDIDNWLGHVHPEDRQQLMATLDRCAHEGGPHTVEYRRQTRTGDWHWIRSVGKVVQRDEAGRATRIIGVHADITEWKRMEEHVRHLAFYDALTGLPNRRLLNDRLSQAMAASKRSGRYGALMFLDLDNFKPLNDTHGHEAGDLLLIEVADRLRACVREADTVARFGGDEFVVMVGELERDNPEESADRVLAVAEKIRVALARPYVLSVPREGHDPLPVEHQCTASIGVAMFVNHELEAAEILKRADMAMYQAKESGRNTTRFFTPPP